MKPPEAELNIKANSIQVMLVAKGLATPNGLASLRLDDPSGKLKLTLPPELFPFVEVNDTVLITISLVKATIVQAPPVSPIILPNQ